MEAIHTHTHNHMSAADPPGLRSSRSTPDCPRDPPSPPTLLVPNDDDPVTTTTTTTSPLYSNTNPHLSSSESNVNVDTGNQENEYTSSSTIATSLVEKRPKNTTGSNTSTNSNSNSNSNSNTSSHTPIMRLPTGLSSPSSISTTNNNLTFHSNKSITTPATAAEFQLTSPLINTVNHLSSS